MGAGLGLRCWIEMPHVITHANCIHEPVHVLCIPTCKLRYIMHEHVPKLARIDTGTAVGAWHEGSWLLHVHLIMTLILGRVAPFGQGGWFINHSQTSCV